MTGTQIRTIDMLLLEELFVMRNGYVLDFTNLTFSHFFAEAADVDIDDPIYAEQGISKGKRLRCFLRKVDAATASKTLRALWEYREALRQQTEKAETIKNAEGRLLSLLKRLDGAAHTTQQAGQSHETAFDRTGLVALRSELRGFTNLTPQKRGYAFEVLLRELFNVYGLEAREPFRLRGEQIDGSFVLQGETYLLEAKWQDVQTGVADLHTFHGKLEQKAAWTRGLFVSHSGFTEQGIAAFGKGKRVICMDGLDLVETLDRELPLDLVLEKKVRKAAETGLPFYRVRDLFPA